jgi:hypothetical protein
MRLPWSRKAREPERAFPSITFEQWIELFKFNGMTYGLPGQSLIQGPYEPPGNFEQYVAQCYAGNGAIFTCMMVRALLFSEARFQFRQFRSGRPGNLFGSKDLALLEEPWPNGTTADLLTRMIQDVDMEGNFFGAVEVAPETASGLMINRLRPDWTSIVVASRIDNSAPLQQRDQRVIGYAYKPGGYGTDAKMQYLPVDQVVHWAPYPDPTARWRGMSWIVPLTSEVLADTAAMVHKLKFFENGATSNMTVTLPVEVSRDQFNEWMEAFKATQEGLDNAYSTLFFGGGAKVEVIGSDMRQIDFKATQGHGETRIAAAAGLPAVIAGFSEGLQATQYASDYGPARERLASGTLRPLWRSAAASLQKVLTLPANGQLWYDDRDIPFLAEDIEKRSNVIVAQTTAMNTLITAGFDPDTVIDAVTSGDLTRLEHTGLISVQLLQPGEQQVQPEALAAGQNGNGTPVLPADEQNALEGEVVDHVALIRRQIAVLRANRD